MPRAAIVGAGSLAWHLAPNLLQIGWEVDVLSRKDVLPNETTAWLPAKRLSIAQWMTTIVKKSNYTAVFLAVPDKAISATSTALSACLPASTPLIHTSGATPAAAIDPSFQQIGVLWPIRSLQYGGLQLEWQDLPLVYFSPQAAFQEQLAEWASQLSQVTYCLADQPRAQLHLAAVFSNNFTNYLCHVAHAICAKHQLPFEAILPIIQHAFTTLSSADPILRQSGAAVRRDHSSMQAHQQLLSDEPAWQALYEQLSLLIQRDTAESFAKKT